jgi:hypothetical protein
MSGLAAIAAIFTRGRSKEPEGPEPEKPEGLAPSQKIDQPLLEAWPTGYESGRFRLVPDGVLLSAAGKPSLPIKD